MTLIRADEPVPVAIMARRCAARDTPMLHGFFRRPNTMVERAGRLMAVKARLLAMSE